MKFAHLGDCHLGGWRFPELQQLNMLSFSKAIDFCIKEKVEMVLIAGDLFDSAYPSIEVLKQTFAEFRRLSKANIPSFIIAGSHDYSVAGKTFLEVLEYAGFCINVFKSEEKNDKIILRPTIFKNFAIYGYPGKKSGLEIPELKKVVLEDAPGFFKILMLHTAIKEAISRLPIDSISISELPKADYYALAHLHINFCSKNVVYSSPIFPNNFEELEELQNGGFFIIDTNNFLNCKKVPIKLKDVLTVAVKVDNSLTATEKIISDLNKYNLKDKIVLLKLQGKLTNGKISDIRFNEIEEFAIKNEAYFFMRNISKLSFEELGIKIELKDVHEVEDNVIHEYFDKNPSKFSNKIPLMLKALTAEKQEDEKNTTFNERLFGELSKILEFDIK